MDPYERFWRARSMFARDEGGPSTAHPFAIVAASLGAGASAGAEPASSPVRPALGPGGGPELAIPLALDASRIADASVKLWPALARAAATAGCALVVTPQQFSPRADVFRAARVATILSVGPEAAAAPSAARAAGAVLMRLSSHDGTPALLDPGALPGWVQACRALSGYRAPAIAAFAPGRRPPWAVLAEARSAGLSALLFEEGAGGASEPLAARAGRAAHAASAAGGVSCLLGSNEPPDGVALCTLLAAGARAVVTAGPVEAAISHENSFAGDWKVHADALSAALNAVWQDACHVARTAGCADPRDLTRDNLRALTYDAAALSGARLAGFDERLPWWVH